MEDINERIEVYVKALATAYNELREELKDLSNENLYDASIIMARAEGLLKSKNCRGVAEVLISIDNEIYQTEREARRLRLMGKLDYEVYETLMDGYVELQKQIIEPSEKHGLDRDVKNAYSFLRIEASIVNRRRVRA